MRRPLLSALAFALSPFLVAGLLLLGGCGGVAPSPDGQSASQESQWDARVVSVNGETAAVESLDDSKRYAASNPFPGLAAGDLVRLRISSGAGRTIVAADSEPGSASPQAP